MKTKWNAIPINKDKNVMTKFKKKNNWRDIKNRILTKIFTKCNICERSKHGKDSFSLPGVRWFGCYLHSMHITHSIWIFYIEIKSLIYLPISIVNNKEQVTLVREHTYKYWNKNQVYISISGFSTGTSYI